MMPMSFLRSSEQYSLSMSELEGIRGCLKRSRKLRKNEKLKVSLMYFILANMSGYFATIFRPLGTHGSEMVLFTMKFSHKTGHS